LGNDLIDAFAVAHGNPHWQSWREAPAAKQAGAAAPAQRLAEPRRRFAALRDWLSHHSVLYAMVRLTVLPGAATWEQRLEASDAPDQYVVWTDPRDASLATIFTPRLRLSALDPGSPQVAEGLRISKRALKVIQGNAASAGARLLVVLIPTKETVYCPRYQASTGQRAAPAMANRQAGPGALSCARRHRSRRRRTGAREEHRRRRRAVSAHVGRTSAGRGLRRHCPRRV
jgi:hypothetical protein